MCPSGAKIETLFVHVGHNSIDKCVSGQQEATQLIESDNKFMLKFKLYRFAMWKFGRVKDGCYGRKTNNEVIYKFNKHLEVVSLELDGSDPRSRIGVLEYALSTDDICFDGGHPNKSAEKSGRKHTSL